MCMLFTSQIVNSYAQTPDTTICVKNVILSTSMGDDVFYPYIWPSFYHASNTIIASNRIELANDEKVTYKAGSSIYLVPDALGTNSDNQFRIQVSDAASFHGMIAPCDEGTFSFRSSDNTKDISDNGLSLREEVIIYPNPVTSEFSVNVERGNYTTISIQDMTGNVHYNQINVDFNNSKFIDISYLPAGVYNVILSGSTDSKVVLITKL